MGLQEGWWQPPMGRYLYGRCMDGISVCLCKQQCSGGHGVEVPVRKEDNALRDLGPVPAQL